MGQETDYDVVVVGAGGAGLSAGVTAASGGLSVLILESEGKAGGSTGHSEGVFNAANTSVQRGLGLTDSIDDYFDYYMTLNAWRQPAGLIRKFCEEATPTLEWLISLGVNIPVQMGKKPKGAVYGTTPEGGGLYAAGVEHPPRGHAPVLGGQEYIDALLNRAGVLGVEVVYNTRVRELVKEGGRVAGVKVGDEIVRSRAVVLGCGGFGHDLELVAKYFPDAYKAMPEGAHPHTVSAPGSRGDGLRMAEAAGAQIIGVNCGYAAAVPYLPSVRHRGRLGFQPNSLIYVNGAGRRFTDETAPYAVMPGLIKQQDFNVWGVFDEAARKRSDPSKGGWSQGWEPELVLECVANGDMKKADTIEELARVCGMAPGALAISVKHYNEDLAKGVDRDFLRDLTDLFPIAEAPFYAFQLRTDKIGLTGAGARIDTTCHVIDEIGERIPGLFAAGESGAGVLGERYVGGGNSVANALTMGRVAGKTLVEELKGAKS